MTPARFENLPADVDVPTSPALGGQPPADTTLSDAWVTIRKRKYVVLAAVLLGIGYGFYQASTQPRLYEAYGSIEIRSGSSNEFRVGSSTVGTTGSSAIPTQLAILKSDTLLLSVARDLNLANKPDFMGAKGPMPFINVDDPNVRQTVIAILQGDIGVSALTKTDIVHISCRTLNPQLSADIVNKLIDEYRLRALFASNDSSKRVSDFLSSSLGDLKSKVEKSQEQMINLEKKLGVLGFDPTHNQITTNLDALTKAAGEAELARILAEVRYRILTGMDRSALDEAIDAKGSVGASQILSLRGQLNAAEANLAGLDAKGNLGPNNPQETKVRATISTLKQQIADEQDRVLKQAQANLLAAKTDENQTKAALEAEKTAAGQLRDDFVAYVQAQREYESSRTLYEGLLQRLRTAGVEAGLESTEIDIIDSAVPPVSPSLKSRSSILMVDTLITLIIGLIVAFILDSLDTGLGSVAEIENVSGLPSLALVPKVRRASSSETANLSTTLRNLQVLANPKSQFSEAFRALRTSLLLSTAGHEPKTILLTSATPSEGKTTVSINLACVLAQRDVRVLLIDADLRRPTVHHRFGLNGKVGLTSVLTGSVPFEQAIQNVPEIPMLDVLVAGPIPPFPTEMLGSVTMKALLKKCEGLYTHIVMDSPPLLSVTDSVVLGRDCDTVVLIVRHGKSSKHAIRRARDLLVRSGAPLTGIVLNAVDLSSPEYYSYYGYYGYSGYASAGVDSAGWESKSDDSSAESRRSKGGKS